MIGKWLKKLVMCILEWLLADSLPDVFQQVREEMLAANRKKAEEIVRLEARKSKKYSRTFTFQDGTKRIVDGDCDEIREWTDARAQQLNPKSPLASVVEKMN